MQFEMDEMGVLHAEESKQQRKSRKLGVVATVIGTAAGYHGAMGLATTGQGYYSRFAQVKSVKAVRNQNLIRVNGGFVRNKIYVSPEKYDFVWEYIVFRCPKGKIYQ